MEHGKEVRFYNIAEGSLEETRYFVMLSVDLEYVQSGEELMAQAETVGRLLNGPIKST